MPLPMNEDCPECSGFAWCGYQSAAIGVTMDGSHHPMCSALRMLPDVMREKDTDRDDFGDHFEGGTTLHGLG